MKTTKTLIVAVLVLVTASTFAQAKKGLFLTVKYSHEMNRIETWASNISERISHRCTDEADFPVISQTYYSDFADISYENEPLIESWMSAPFDEAFFEDALTLEAWMSDPFESDELQDELSLEDWMSTPFETEEIILVEKWMTSSNW